MRITFLLAANDYSGGCQVIIRIAQYLERRGHDIRLICPKKPIKTLREFVRDVVKKRRFAVRDSQVGHADLMPSSLTYVTSGAPIRPTDALESDVVVATWFETAHWLAKFPPSAGGKLYLMMDYGAPNMPLDRLIPTWRYPFFFVTLTNALAAMIKSENQHAPVYVMKCAIDCEVDEPVKRQMPNIPTIGFAYNNLSSKGMELAIDAVLNAKQAYPDLNVLCFGRQRPKDLPQFITFIENPTDQSRNDLYSSCTAWLFPSLLEGFGLPIIEAMAAGTPVIGTRAGAAPDLLRNNHNGILLESFDSHEMAAAIGAIINKDSDDWLSLSHAAFVTVSSYTWDDAVDIFEMACVAANESTCGLARTSA